METITKQYLPFSVMLFLWQLCLILVNLSTHLGLCWSPVACSWPAGYPSYQMHWRNEGEESGQVVELQDWASPTAVGL